MKRRTRTQRSSGPVPTIRSAESIRNSDAHLSKHPGHDTSAAGRASASWHTILLAAGVIVLAAVAVYHNSFGGVFAYDDQGAIVQNTTIRHLWPIWVVLVPPHSGETVSGRPLLNLTLAINYAISSLNVWSYHVTNLLIHIATALLLFGILRRTFLTPTLQDRFGKAATWLALASVLLWTVHPLQTESVTYIVQRAESLAGLFYLLTLYCVIRGAGSERWRLWYAGAVVACLLGVACKETLLTAPLMALVYDRTFLAGSFRQALRRRWGLYVGLAASWSLLAYLVVSTGLIVRQAELGAPGPLAYARSQPGVILYYLRLAVWPDCLCMSYQWPVANTLGEILPGTLVVGVLLALILWGLVRRKAWGFLGAWFFLILAPTSSVMPLNQLVHEHRMYLSLAALAALATAVGYLLCDRVMPRSVRSGYTAAAVRWAAPFVILAAALLTMGYATIARNSVYQSEVAIWQDGVHKSPNDLRARNNLGVALMLADSTGKAMEEFREAVRLRPDDPGSHINLGVALASSGKTNEAIAQFREALRLSPDFGAAHTSMGLALATSGKFDEAIQHYHEALRLNGDDVLAHQNLGNLLATLGRSDEAIRHYREALRREPVFLQHKELGNVLARAGRTGEAIEQWEEALRLKPDDAEARYNLAGVLDRSGRTNESVEQYNQFLQLLPNSVAALNNLAWLLATHEEAEGGDPRRAVQFAQRARDLAGQENAQCLDTLAAAYAADGRFPDAVMTAERAAQLAETAGQPSLVRRIQSRLELYRAGRPYREAPRAATRPVPEVRPDQ